jgi:hypothetical protein
MIRSSGDRSVINQGSQRLLRLDEGTPPIQYHERLYAERALFEPGSWLRAPASFVIDEMAGGASKKTPKSWISAAELAATLSRLREDLVRAEWSTVWIC